MATISRKDRDVLTKYFQMEGGYVLDFSNRTFSTFFEDFDVDIEDERYSQGYPSNSKGNRMKGFWDIESEANVGRVLLGLIEYYDEKREDSYSGYQKHSDEQRAKCLAICNELANGTYNPAETLGAKLARPVRQHTPVPKPSHTELESIFASPSELGTHQVQPYTQPTQTQQDAFKQKIRKQRIFVVHGHDDVLRLQVENFIRKIDLEPVVLMDQANSGDTIIEKIERCGNADFAIVLYTPCDVGRNKDADKLQGRARQNVVFEHGYFIARLGREKVAAIIKQGVEIQNDIQGLVYLDSNNWQHQLLKEFKSAQIKFNADSLYT